MKHFVYLKNDFNNESIIRKAADKFGEEFSDEDEQLSVMRSGAVGQTVTETKDFTRKQKSSVFSTVQTSQQRVDPPL